MASVSVKNNFDFLRLAFASFVIITHSFALTGMNEWENDWLSKLTHGQMTLSFIGVRGFFTISGFLIFQSLTRSKGVVDYFWKRVLRIYPALIVVLLLTVILAVFPYPYGVNHYLHNPSVAGYFLNNITLFKLQYSIDGLFMDLPNKAAINGSLWTIPYEFSFYILLAGFFLIKKGFEKYTLLFLFILLLNVFFFRDFQSHSIFYLDTKFIVELGTYFVAGSLLAAFNIESIPHKRPVFLAALVMFLLSIKFLNFQLFQFYTLPVLVILFGISSTKYISNIGTSIGDLSYGIYIYGYPVQQTLMHYFKFNYWQLMIVALLVTFVLAYGSWHLIEKRALKLKKINIQQVWGQLFKPKETETQVAQNK